MNSRALIPVLVAAGVCFGIGYWSGYGRSSSQRNDGAEQLVPRGMVSALIARDGKAGSALAKVALDPQLQWEAKLRCYFAILEDAEVGQLLGLLRAADRDVPSSAGRLDLEFAIFGQWAELDLEGLLSALVAGELEFADAWPLSAAAEQDLVAAWEFLARHPNGTQWLKSLAGHAAQRFHFWGSGASGEDCLALLKTADLSAIPTETLDRLVQQVAAEVPDKVLDPELGLPSGLLRREVLASVLGGMAERNLEAALVQWEDFDVDDRVGVGGELIRKWAKVDPAAALSSVRALPDSAARGKVLAEVLTVIGKSSPESAADAIWEVSSPSLRERVLRVVAIAWAAADPAAALGWADGLGEPRYVNLAKRLVESERGER